MKKLFLYLILLFTSVNIYAQPGYLGKRLSLHLSGDFFPSFKNDGTLNTIGITFRGIKSTGGMLASYVSSENNIIELGFTQFKDWNAIYDYKIDDITGIDYIKQNCLVFNYKMFHKKAIPPIGAYLKLSIGITQNMFAKNIDFDNPETLYGIKIGAGFGKQRVFFNRIVFDYGLTSYLNILGIKQIITSNSFDLPIERVISHDYLNIHIGIGYLLF